MDFVKRISVISEIKKCLGFKRSRRRVYSTLKNTEWKPVVGLEIHAQIQSASKLFSGAGTDFCSSTNKSVALFDAAFPGTLPVLNQQCVKAGVLTALALSCDLNEVSSFDRKHYFYSDLPAGYQITQQRSPLARNGILKFVVYKGGENARLYETSSQIHQIQLEQDSGRSLHDKDRSLVDLNRAGLPLMELVFKPDISDGEEAASLVKELCLILTRLGTCSCKMEEGALRVDANVSVHKEGTPLGARTEVKNIGSIRAVANAIDFEIARQIKLLHNGQEVINETRSWDSETLKTVPMRDKEEKQDYRFMPEPNLPPLHLRMRESQPSHPHMVDVLALKNKIPESPFEMRQRYQKEYNISLLQAVRLVNEDALLPLFAEAMSDKKDRNATILTNLLLNDILTVLNENSEIVFTVRDVGCITDMLDSGIISKSIARSIIAELAQGSNMSANEIVAKKGWSLISDQEVLEDLCRCAIQENEKILKKHVSGKKNGIEAFAKIVWKKTDGRANMKLVKEWFQKNLPYAGK